MSQICPSSSHQLVAAAIAFRRARRKFPKNYGLYGNSEDATNVDKAESAMVNEEANDQENLWFSSRKCSNATPSRVEAKATWSDEYAESGSIKESLLQKPIICSCCRKRNEAAKANEPMSIFKTRDQCSAGDTLDVVPSKEHNEIARKSDPSQLEQLQKYDMYISSLALHGDSECNLLRVQTSSSFARNVNYLNANATDEGS